MKMRSGWLRERSGLLILTLIALVYTVVWSYISIHEYLSFHDFVYDLGVVMERGWLILHTHWTAYSLIHEYLYSGIVFIVGPIFSVIGFKAILVFQSAFIGFSAVALYLIARHFISEKLPSILIASAFLIYFPLAGLNWYDFHYQAMFVPLFIGGYAFYLRGNTKISMLLLFLSGITRFPYIIFPALLSIIILVEVYRDAARPVPEKRKLLVSYALFSMLLIIQLLASIVMIHGISGISSDVHIQNAATNTSGIYHLDDKIETIAMILLPVLGIPLLSRKWSLFLIPPFTLIFIASNPVYLFPRTFMMQYAAGIAPFIFLGLIEALPQLGDREPKASSVKPRLSRNAKTAITILAITALLGTVYLPYGPFNNQTLVDYHLHDSTSINSTLRSQYESLASLIPSNQSNVVIQNNLPSLLPRPLQNGTILVPGINIAQNMTYRGSNGLWHNVNPDYILVYPQGNYFKYTPKYGPYDISMYKVINNLYAQSNYGILGEASGMILLEKNYNGPLEYYKPFMNYTSATGMNIPPASTLINNVITTHNNASDTFAWYGPYTTLIPGTYNITYHVSATNNSSSNALDLTTSANVGSLVLASKSVNGTAFKGNNRVTNITQTVSVQNIYSYVEFRGYIGQWSGQISLHGVSVKEIAPYSIPLKSHALISLMGNDPSVVTQRSFVPYFNSTSTYTPSTYANSDNASFILGDVNYQQFWSASGKLTMNQLINSELKSGQYAIRAEGNGMILLQKNYAGKPELIAPSSHYFAGSAFTPGPRSELKNGSLLLSNASAGVVWYGPYTTLIPGQYNVTIALSTTSNTSSNNLTVFVTSNSGATLLKKIGINGTDFAHTNSTQEISFNLTVANAQDLVEIRGYNANWSGTLSLESVSVIQSSA